MRRFLFALACAGLAFPAQAITFMDSKRPDPFAEAGECETPEIGSWGSYVYQYNSKFDLVFEPFASLVWKCPSGFVSYPYHFENIPEPEKKRIAEYLKDQLQKESLEREALLGRLGDLYELRELTRKEKAWVYRALAYGWRQDPRADVYRKKALALHKQILAEEKPQGRERIDMLYIIGFYTWRLESPAAAEPYFQELRNVKWQDNEKKSRTGDEYIDAMIAEIREGKADDKVRYER